MCKCTSGTTGTAPGSIGLANQDLVCAVGLGGGPGRRSWTWPQNAQQGCPRLHQLAYPCCVTSSPNPNPRPPLTRRRKSVMRVRSRRPSWTPPVEQLAEIRRLSTIRPLVDERVAPADRLAFFW
mmetsp:Transcript_30534/g.60417  ORF Transcript_30534/g.60417 Transcript_30534/m.60417 type:complete len:124 (+) Transcript_30534:393-764(+)